MNEMRFILDFKNGYRVSMINTEVSYGLEVAVIKDDEWQEIKGFTDESGIMAYTNAERIAELLDHLKDL